MELIIAVVIVIVLLIALKVYTYKKARYYRELGYSIVYYYMNNCGDLQYYRNKGYDDEWIKARLIGIIDRFKLTDVWKQGGINKPIEYVFLVCSPISILLVSS